VIERNHCRSILRKVLNANDPVFQKWIYGNSGKHAVSAAVQERCKLNRLTTLLLYHEPGTVMHQAKPERAQNEQSGIHKSSQVRKVPIGISDECNWQRNNIQQNCNRSEKHLQSQKPEDTHPANLIRYKSP